MDLITFDYLERLDTILPFKNTVEALRKKYGYPLKYSYDPHADAGGRPGVTDVFYEEFVTLSSTIIAYLKKEFPVETADAALFRDNLQKLVMPFSYTVAPTGLDAWIAGETRPEPHGGYPGCQWLYENSPTGRVTKLVPVLIRAYTMCTTAKAARLDKEAKFQESKRIAEEIQKAKDKAAKVQYQQKVAHYTKLLCDSLDMHYFPEQVIRGVGRPAEWRPSFNLDVMKAVDKAFGAPISKNIIAGAKIVSEKKAVKMMEDYKKEQDEKRWKEEERKAMIMAKAMLVAKARSNTIVPTSDATTEDPQ